MDIFLLLVLRCRIPPMFPSQLLLLFLYLALLHLMRTVECYFTHTARCFWQSSVREL